MANEMSRDVLADGLEEACSEVFPGRGDYGWAPGLDLEPTPDEDREYEWVWINPTTQKLVKRTSPR